MSRARGPLQIPPWVPEQLTGRYIDIAARFGEEQAASAIRNQKREPEFVRRSRAFEERRNG